jgi:hypothetical protein
LSVTDLAMTVTWAPVGTTAGAIKIAAIPLVVEGGLNDPQASTGVQLQATPAWALSFDTVAETAAVPPGTTLEDSGDNATEMDRNCVAGCVVGCEELPPQPELSIAKINAASENHDSPLIPFLKFIRPPSPGRGMFPTALGNWRNSCTQ